MKTIIGIDPGQSGGIAWMNQRGVEVIKMPDTERDIVDALRAMIYEAPELERGVKCYLELVHSMPRQGVASSFKFGKGYGVLIGVLSALEIPFELVTPQKWQKAMGCMSKGDKNVTKRKAQQLFPRLKITHATADALLIAAYGAIQDGNV
jgi:crossover junction endodeoxyribonuclease RuvC